MQTSWTRATRVNILWARKSNNGAKPCKMRSLSVVNDCRNQNGPLICTCLQAEFITGANLWPEFATEEKWTLANHVPNSRHEKFSYNMKNSNFRRLINKDNELQDSTDRSYMNQRLWPQARCLSSNVYHWRHSTSGITSRKLVQKLWEKSTYFAVILSY